MPELIEVGGEMILMGQRFDVAAHAPNRLVIQVEVPGRHIGPASGRLTPAPAPARGSIQFIIGWPRDCARCRLACGRSKAFIRCIPSPGIFSGTWLILPPSDLSKFAKRYGNCRSYQSRAPLAVLLVANSPPQPADESSIQVMVFQHVDVCPYSH